MQILLFFLACFLPPYPTFRCFRLPLLGTVPAEALCNYLAFLPHHRVLLLLPGSGTGSITDGSRQLKPRRRRAGHGAAAFSLLLDRPLRSFSLEPRPTVCTSIRLSSLSAVCSP